MKMNMLNVIFELNCGLLVNFVRNEWLIMKVVLWMNWVLRLWWWSC